MVISFADDHRPDASPAVVSVQALTLAISGSFAFIFLGCLACLRKRSYQPNSNGDPNTKNEVVSNTTDGTTAKENHVVEHATVTVPTTLKTCNTLDYEEVVLSSSGPRANGSAVTLNISTVIPNGNSATMVNENDAVSHNSDPPHEPLSQTKSTNPTLPPRKTAAESSSIASVTGANRASVVPSSGVARIGPNSATLPHNSGAPASSQTAPASVINTKPTASVHYSSVNVREPLRPIDPSGPLECTYEEIKNESKPAGELVESNGKTASRPIFVDATATVAGASLSSTTGSRQSQMDIDADGYSTTAGPSSLSPNSPIKMASNSVFRSNPYDVAGYSSIQNTTTPPATSLAGLNSTNVVQSEYAAIDDDEIMQSRIVKTLSTQYDTVQNTTSLHAAAGPGAVFSGASIVQSEYAAIDDDDLSPAGGVLQTSEMDNKKVDFSYLYTAVNKQKNTEHKNGKAVPAPNFVSNGSNGSAAETMDSIHVSGEVLYTPVIKDREKEVLVARSTEGKISTDSAARDNSTPLSNGSSSLGPPLAVGEDDVQYSSVEDVEVTDTHRTKSRHHYETITTPSHNYEVVCVQTERGRGDSAGRAVLGTGRENCARSDAHQNLAVGLESGQEVNQNESVDAACTDGHGWHEENGNGVVGQGGISSETRGSDLISPGNENIYEDVDDAVFSAKGGANK